MEPGELTGTKVEAGSDPGTAAKAGAESLEADQVRRLELANAKLLETNSALARAAFAKRSSAAAISLAKRDAHLAEVEAELVRLRDDLDHQKASLEARAAQLETEKAQLEVQLAQLGASHESLQQRLESPRHRAADRLHRRLARNRPLSWILTRAGAAARRRS